MRTGNPLVCPSCWAYLFAPGAFQEAWAATYPSGGFSYTISWGAIQQSAGEGCGWCRILVAEIPSYLPFSGKPNPAAPETTFEIRVRFVQPKFGKGGLVRTPATLNLQIDGVFSQKYEVHAASDDPAGRYVATRELIYQVSSPTAFQHSSTLLQECVSATDGHELCLPSHTVPLPTRVIDCLDPLHPKLVITQGKEDRYATLSYVWGADQAHKTTTKNLEVYLVEIPISLLPQTICDAIKSTPLLGLRYLWIDSLCIIQDSDDDKAREIARMREVYQHAFVTIIAANANKATDGFLQDRPAPPEAIRLPFQCPDGAIGVMSLRGGATEPEDPVDSRAWCFQERILACRKLVFASDTVRYECNALSVNIGNVNTALWRERVRLPPALLHPKIRKSVSLSRDDALELETTWGTLVTNYTQRHLSHAADKLPAFYGVAELFHREAWGDSRYLAGLWERNLLEELLWQKGGGPRLPKSENYRAPSWSWAAINGSIIPAFQMHHWGEDKAECEVLSVEVTLKRPEMIFGEVTGGTLKLNVAKQKVVWDAKQEKVYITLEGGDREDKLVGSAYADDPEDPPSAQGQVWAIPLRSSRGVSFMIEGLILVPVDGNEGRLRRVGMFQVPTMKSPAVAKRWLDAEREEVVII